MSPNRPVLLAGILLFAGFGAGFFAGRESLRQSGGATVAAVVPGAADPHAGHDHAAAEPAGSMAEASMPARKGHTFTGEINAPPHGPEGHKLAQSLLAGATCPCGGCQGMMLLECGCDMAREVEGLAAHLLERGKPSAEVLAQLSQHYGLASGGRSSSAAALPDGLDGLADAFGGPAIRGPAEVPSSARRTAPR